MKLESDCIIWSWEGHEVRVGYDRLGVGPLVLLLPALSSISTRREMRPLQERLASDFATVAIDWPGFWRPAPPANPMATWSSRGLSALCPYPCGYPSARHGSCRARRELRPLVCCCFAEFSREVVPDRSNLARPLADHDGWTTSGGRMDRPRK